MLCLEHVKEFNKNWNYFPGMNDEQVINFLKSDMTWHKPTQSFSSSDNFFKILWNNTLKDELDKEKFKTSFNHASIKFDHKDIKAFGILGISVVRLVKFRKFKMLVKKFHPDMVSDKKFEEKLKLITLAYTQLKNTYREKLTPNLNIQPDIKVSVKQTFGIDTEMEVDAFSKKNEYVPEIDKTINLIEIQR